MVPEHFKICFLNKVSEDRLIEVRKDMDKLGTPTIQVFKLWENIYLAIDGSHRLTICKERNIIPVLDVICEFSEYYEEDREYYIEFDRRRKKGLLISFP